MVGEAQPTGWPRREFFDERDKYYVPKTYFDLTKISPLNLRTHPTYGAHFHKIYDQRQPSTALDRNCWATCTANAAAAAFDYECKRQGLPALQPSRLFLYFNARQLAWAKHKKPWNDPNSKSPAGQGSFIRLAFKSIHKDGVCAEADWGYDDAHFAAKPLEDTTKKALENHVAQYARLDPDQPEGVEKSMTPDEKEVIGAMTLLRLRQCLAEGYPVVFGFKYYWEVAPFTKDDASGIWALPPLPSKTGPPSDKFPGHSVLAIGFDDEEKRILCQNSWGEAVEGAPFFWIGYDWIRDFEATSDFWMMRLVEKPK
ncbi:hypothetical protein B0H67DRAFT_573084 [Lasiosphaeris hirsuta]|uniref:Peptidase C1A papain C-terminal domain-containing protein n=1 Tax=Lasiosphaeris hirsuta TaxID=260670 RepID=A0AA40DZK1_9PEZI|nr:hypothetical protein B0H67DRAFT_573084 [Lasiosphaeris hirsuta]